MTRAKMRRIQGFPSARGEPGKVEPARPEIPTGTPWLEAEEAAAYMRIGLSKLLELSGARSIASYKLGARVVYRKGDLDEYIKAHERKAFVQGGKR